MQLFKMRERGVVKELSNEFDVVVVERQSTVRLEELRCFLQTITERERHERWLLR